MTGDEIKELNALQVKMAEHENRIKVSEHRIEDIEVEQREIRQLAISVEKLAISVENLASEQKRQRDDLSKLKSEPGENWKKAVWIIIAALIAYALARLGLKY